MTRVEQLHTERAALMGTVEGFLKEVSDCKDAARIEEINAKIETAYSDRERIDRLIGHEEKLEQFKVEDAAREEARKSQAPRQADAVRQMAPHDNDLSPLDLEERARINTRYMKGEPLSDEDHVKRSRLTNAEKAFWRAQRAPKGAYPIAQDYGQLSQDLVKLGVISEEKGMQMRALSTTASTTAADGGNTIPEGFVAELVRSMKEYGPLNDPGIARQMVTPTGNPMDWPTVNDTANKATLVAEATDVTDKKVTFGELSLNAYKYTTGFFPVTSEILQDSAFDFEGELRGFMSERFGRGLNEAFTSADGSSKPQGVVSKIGGVAARVQHMGTAKVIKLNDMFNVIGKLDPAYRGNARWMFNATTELEFHKLADSDGRPLLQPDIANGMRGVILGYPYILNQDMDSSTDTDKEAVLFGDFMKFVVRRVRALSINRLDEIAARSDQVVFVGFGRFDSEVLDTDAFVALNTATS